MCNIQAETINRDSQEVLLNIDIMGHSVSCRALYSIGVRRKDEVRITSCKEIGRDRELVGMFIFSNDMFAGLEDELQERLNDEVLKEDEI